MDPEVIYGVSRTQLSVARHYGRCQFNGQLYHYNPADDTLTRADVLRARKQWTVIIEIDGKMQAAGTFPTRAKAMTAARKAKADACLFGPGGLDYAPLRERVANER